jgi:hypothetical protein
MADWYAAVSALEGGANNKLTASAADGAALRRATSAAVGSSRTRRARYAAFDVPRCDATFVSWRTKADALSAATTAVAAVTHMRRVVAMAGC